MLPETYIPTQPHTSCARAGEAVTPADGGDLPHFSYRGIIVGTAGNLKVDFVNGPAGVVIPVPVGYLPIQIRKVYATGTTAVGITALW